MEQFDIKKAIKHYNLTFDEVASVLFPRVKYPKKAFERVLTGEALLNTQQMTNLAAHIGVTTYDLFFANSWKAATHNGILCFINGPYKVKLNYEGALLSIFKNDKLIERRLCNAYGMTVQNFLNHINTTIKNYEKHGSI